MHKLFGYEPTSSQSLKRSFSKCQNNSYDLVSDAEFLVEIAREKSVLLYLLAYMLEQH